METSGGAAVSPAKSNQVASCRSTRARKTMKMITRSTKVTSRRARSSSNAHAVKKSVTWHMTAHEILILNALARLMQSLNAFKR